VGINAAHDLPAALYALAPPSFADIMHHYTHCALPPPDNISTPLPRAIACNHRQTPRHLPADARVTVPPQYMTFIFNKKLRAGLRAGQAATLGKEKGRGS